MQPSRGHLPLSPWVFGGVAGQGNSYPVPFSFRLCNSPPPGSRLTIASPLPHTLLSLKQSTLPNQDRHSRVQPPPAPTTHHLPPSVGSSLEEKEALFFVLLLLQGKAKDLYQHFGSYQHLDLFSTHPALQEKGRRRTLLVQQP